MLTIYHCMVHLFPWLSTSSGKLTSFLRRMSKKGFFQILKFVNERGDVHYNDVLRYAMANKVVESRSTVTVILNGLSDLGLVDRMVSSHRPIRTSYRLNKKGKTILQVLQEIERE